jgi:hypothetical protein
MLPIHSLRSTLRNRYRLLKAVRRGGAGSAASGFLEAVGGPLESAAANSKIQWWAQ